MALYKRKRMSDIAKYYDELAVKHGPGFASADAGSQESVEARYIALRSIYDMSNKTVLDVGCGTGGLAPWVTCKEYTGIDISAKAVEIGKKATGFNLIHADICQYAPIDVMTGKPKKYDVVLAQGIFYKLPADHTGYYQVVKMIESMFQLSNEVVAFTALCTWPYGPSKTELRLDPAATLELLRRFTSKLVLRTDYWKGDALFVAHRDK